LYGSDNSRNLLKDYTNVSAKLSMIAAKQCSINLSVDNLFDETYQTILGYPMPGRIVSAGINIQL
jgi:outer membrane cobalamin receptor